MTYYCPRCKRVYSVAEYQTNRYCRNDNSWLIKNDVPFTNHKDAPPLNDDAKKKIRDILLDFSDGVQKSYLHDLLKSMSKIVANKFLVATILNQGVGFKRAWNGSDILAKRLGHFDPNVIGQMSLERLENAIRGTKSLHRFPRRMADYIKESCRLLANRYASDFSNVWNDLSPNQTSVLIGRFNEFKGIAQKKATMMTRILYERGHLPHFDTSSIDISIDRHVVRVLLRTGLLATEKQNDILRTTRQLFPSFPARLDPSLWKIGQEYCHRNNPNCPFCPLTEYCAKLTDRMETNSY